MPEYLHMQMLQLYKKKLSDRNGIVKYTNQIVIYFSMATSQYSDCLSGLLCKGGDFLLTLMQMLQPADITNMLHLNSKMHSAISLSNFWTNRLYYNQRLEIERSHFFDYQVDAVEARQHLNDVLFSITTDQLEFQSEIQAFKDLQKHLALNFCRLVGKNQAKKLSDNIRLVFVEPDMPMPGLMREGKADYCNTCIQLLMVDQTIFSFSQGIGSLTYQLRREILENASQIYAFVGDSKNEALVKRLRYNPEVYYEYVQTDLPLTNLIQLILLISRNYIRSIKKFLAANQQTWDEGKLLTEFMIRFSILRYTICGLQDNYGFLFTNFAQAFTPQHSDYPQFPVYSLWKTILKIWVQEMSQFHNRNNDTLGKVMLLQLDGVAEGAALSYISKKELPDNSLVECEYLKSSSHNLTTQLISMPHEQSASLFGAYQQYLVDISANQFSICWSGSTEQRLKGPYVDAEVPVLQAVRQFCIRLTKTYSTPLIIKNTLTACLRMLVEQVKPATLVKIQAIIFQNASKTSQLSATEQSKQEANKWEPKSFDNSRNDKRVRFMARDQQADQQIGQKFSDYFATYQTVDMPQMERKIKQMLKEKQDSLAGQEPQNEEDLGVDQVQDVI